MVQKQKKIMAQMIVKREDNMIEALLDQCRFVK